ncbi:G-protein coupled receptors family 1 profile domain-containing protein [Caenorhabditis elegans]|uniref:G-protein coupled receptors family 1 profile domain-containing protein n=1 Tax=Caenorhabditis elegans TaxID=6239 RepID=Q20841_CAEEL|nr:G-protein coupled receptors family 1 profile domain-containing protein [Caenorhabditis elegans]CCD70891.1 G-protein coupled receptors family 1 profile domain-containing protein [Caenorhabditis elegans]|eukprot:NP_509416.2 NeuroPeptide Receptor family [Caenorhabditis elegans]
MSTMTISSTSILTTVSTTTSSTIVPSLNDPMEIQFEIMFVMVLYSCLAVTGVGGNCWVLIKVIKQLSGCSSNRSRPYKTVVQSSAYVYLIILSVVDLFSLIPVPMIVTDVYVNHFPFGLWACKLSYFCEAINKSLSPMVLTALSVDRYIAVCHPTLYWLRTTKFSLGVLAVCFSVSLIFIIPVTKKATMQVMKDNTDEEIIKCAFDHGDSASYVFDTAQAIVCYLVPLFIICAVYLAILHKLFIHTRFSTVGKKTSISLGRVVKCSVMVVAFYFICWTPYWTMRIHYLVTRFIETNSDGNSTVIDEVVAAVAEEVQDGIETSYFFGLISKKRMHNIEIALIYILHSLTYAQSAFNWLFYSFLNRNLRSNNGRGNGTRSAANTSVFDNGNATSTVNTSLTPIWKNIQQMGSHIKTAGLDTRSALMKKSPFKGKSKIQSRSAAYLDCSSAHMLRPSSENTLSSSLLDIPRRPSLIPRQEPSLVGKALSFTNIPQPQYQRIEPKEESSHGAVSESSSVEWL